MAKHRTGHVFRRGKNFYCRWAIDGKVFSRSLRDDQGNPITNKRDADVARGKLMAPWRVGDETAALESIVGKLEGRRAELTKLEDHVNPPLALAMAWDEYFRSPNRPDSGPETLPVYEGQFGQFTKWMAERYPTRDKMRDVTADIAEEYA